MTKFVKVWVLKRVLNVACGGILVRPSRGMRKERM